MENKKYFFVLNDFLNIPKKQPEFLDRNGKIIIINNFTYI